jgi:hypothetical protein
MHTAGPAERENLSSEVEITVTVFRRYKPPSVVEISTGFIQSGYKSLLSEIHKLVTFIRNKKKLSQKWKESVILSVC